MENKFFEFDDPDDCRTTAIYPNRINDKMYIEEKYKLYEFGNLSTKFFTPINNLFAIGYIRVVYGDHGPYVEFDRENVKMELLKKFNNNFGTDNYYEWLIPSDGSNMKVYDQKRTVTNLKNPPKGGYNGNRKEGYADYKIGKIYVSPDNFGSIIN